MRHFLSVSMLLLLCYLLISCTPNPETAIQLPAYNDCGSCCNYLQFDSTEFDLAKLDSVGLDSAGRYKISEACVNCLVNNFKKNGYAFPPVQTDTGLVNVKAFLMQDTEIQAFEDIIENISKDTSLSPDVKIYGIFGIYHGKLSKNSRTMITTPHQVFSVEVALEVPADTVFPVAFGYYNFIRPCPDFCPGVMEELEKEPVECEEK